MLKCHWMIAIAALFSVTPGARADEPLNLVIITADTLRADFIGPNGNREVKTPVLDALATDSVTFTRAYTNITTTTPAHASLFTSLYPHEHGAYSNEERIQSSHQTLHEVLRERGYHTAAIVNFPWLNPEVSNVLQGVDELARCHTVRKADATNSWVMSFIGRAKSAAKPFFLWIQYIDNHTPYHAPGKFEQMYYPPDRNPRSPEFTSMARAKPLFPLNHMTEPAFARWIGDITDTEYFTALNKGSVSWIDAQIGEVIQHLKRWDLWDRTLFVLLSDHGESLGEHQIFYSHTGIYEVTARVALIVRMPGGPRGQTVPRLVQLTDVMPTVLARLGIETPPESRGQDIWPLLGSKGPDERALLLEHAGQRLIGVVTARHKYILHLKSQGIVPGYQQKRGREELYDLEVDPGEQNDLGPMKPPVLAELRALLERLRGETVSTESEPALVDVQTKEMLRSLGY